jgi:hypothetical protein
MYKRFYGILLIVATLFITQSFTSHAQIVRDGIKIKVFIKSERGKSESIESEVLGDSPITCCTGVDGKFDRIELSGNASITVMVREGSASENRDMIYLNRGYYLDKKAVFKPFEGRENFGIWTISIMKEDKVILQFEYEFLSCT